MALMMDQLVNVVGPASESSHKLQAHKSSYQAWKCVSFGCSLLAIVLLMSKWYEVSTDLKLLVGIDQLLTLQATANTSSQLTWPPVPLDQLLPATNTNESANMFGLDTMESNNSMLMSHMHMSLNRELNGNQLLRQEVEVFAAEFRNAKSTLSLSSMLVSIYIVSWILMTLAISDTRISNDISLRNILLLSVFGAIDMAASVGFVMVRVIMYTVKNGSFASEILATGGIKDTPVRLSADQLTAFTALRLIAMRSCSAHIDIYVSVLVALLTILRLYAIFKALTYYRRLRRLNDRFQYRQLHLEQHHHHNQQQQQQHHNALQSANEHKQIWSTSSFLNRQNAQNQQHINNNNTNNQIHGHHQMISPGSLKSHQFLVPPPNPRHRYNVGATTFEENGSYHPLGLIDPTEDQDNISNNNINMVNESSQQQQQQLANTGTFRCQAQSVSTASLPLANQMIKQVAPLNLTEQKRTTGASLIILPKQKQHQQQQHRQQYKSSTLQQPQKSRLSSTKRQQMPYQAYRMSTPNLVLVNGRPHRIVNEMRSDKQQQQQQQQQQQTISKTLIETNNTEQPQVIHASKLLAENEPLPTGLNFRRLNESEATTVTVDEKQQEENEMIMMSEHIDTNNNISNNNNLIDDDNNNNTNTFYKLAEECNSATNELSKQMQSEAKQQTDQVQTTRTLIGTTMTDANGASYTLLSAHQMEKLSRKLLTANGTTSAGKYKLLARYKHSPVSTNSRPKSMYINSPTHLAQQQHQQQQQIMRQQQVLQQVAVESPSCSSSVSCEADDSDGSLIMTSSVEQRRNQLHHIRQQLNAERQTEEYLASDNQQHRATIKNHTRQVFELAGEQVELSPVSIATTGKGGNTINQQLLLGKCSGSFLFGNRCSLNQVGDGDESCSIGSSDYSARQTRSNSH